MASVAFASLVSGSAVAADMPVKAVYKAPPVYVHSWTGCFVGGNVGGVWVNKDWSVGAGDPSIGVAGIAAGQAFGSHNANGWLGGFQAGCDYQFAGGWVIGIQGDYDWTRANGSSVDAINNRFFGVTGYNDTSSVNSLASVTGRLGYAWDRFLGYVRGGYAWERDSYSITNPTNFAIATASQTRGGWTIGVGGEYAFTNMISAFIEYDYYDFGTKNNRFLTGAGTLFELDRHQGDQERRQGRPQLPLRR